MYLIGWIPNEGFLKDLHKVIIPQLIGLKLPNYISIISKALINGKLSINIISIFFLNYSCRNIFIRRGFEGDRRKF